MNPLRSPFYLLLAFLACLYLAAANLRGWSLLQPYAAASARSHGPATRHK